MNLVLGGDVATQFTYGKEEDFENAIEAARAEQELVCGYSLKLRSMRQTHQRDVEGRDVYEVFATFEPAIPQGRP